MTKERRKYYVAVKVDGGGEVFSFSKKKDREAFIGDLKRMGVDYITGEDNDD